MRHGTLIGLAAALAACGVATTVPNDSADAQQRRGRPQPKQPANSVRVPNFDYPGGMAGCFDPNLSGYPRAAAERAGGVPCATPRRTTTNNPASRGTTWIVGWWIEREEFCGEGGVTYRADGTYTTDIQTGRWRLSGNTLIETPLTNEEEGGRIRNPQPERSQILSVAANRNAFTVRYPDGRVWNMKRCR